MDFISLNKSRGFTLIEILVTMTIIALIAGIGLVSYGHAQLLARDSRRKQDLRAVSTALELYYQKNKRYPCATSLQTSPTTPSFWLSDTGFAGCGGSSAIPLDNNYINTMPIDHFENNFSLTTASTYGYAYQTPSGLSGGSCPTGSGNYYVLYTRLENTQDRERCAAKVYNRCDNTAHCSANNNDASGMLFIVQP